MLRNRLVAASATGSLRVLAYYDKNGDPELFILPQLWANRNVNINHVLGCTWPTHRFFQALGPLFIDGSIQDSRKDTGMEVLVLLMF